jgi:hypothetical protein
MQFDATNATFLTIMPISPSYNSTTSDGSDVTVVPHNADSLALTRYIVQNVLVPIVVSVGVTGNSISMVVLTRKSMKSSTNCYLCALALFDSLYLLFSLTLSFKHYGEIRDLRLYKHWFPWGRVFTDIWSNVSVILTVTFTVERCIGVCFPMKKRVLCTPKRARIVIAFVVFIAVACTAPEFFEWKIIESFDQNSNVTKVQVSPTDFALTFSYQIGYSWFLSAIFTFIPLVALFTFNSILIYSIIKASRIRRTIAYMAVKRSTERSQDKQQRITLMLVAVVVVFILCQCPTAILLLYSVYLDKADVDVTDVQRNQLRMTGNVTNLLIQINAAINFYLYSVMSTKFRRVLLKLCCICVPYTLQRKYSLSESSYRGSSVVSTTRSSVMRNSLRRGQNESLRSRKNDSMKSHKQESVWSNKSLRPNPNPKDYGDYLKSQIHNVISPSSYPNNCDETATLANEQQSPLLVCDRCCDTQL